MEPFIKIGAINKENTNDWATKWIEIHVLTRMHLQKAKSFKKSPNNFVCFVAGN